MGGEIQDDTGNEVMVGYGYSEDEMRMRRWNRRHINRDGRKRPDHHGTPSSKWEGQNGYSRHDYEEGGYGGWERYIYGDSRERILDAWAALKEPDLDTHDGYRSGTRRNLQHKAKRPKWTKDQKRQESFYPTNSRKASKRALPSDKNIPQWAFHRSPDGRR